MLWPLRRRLPLCSTSSPFTGEGEDVVEDHFDKWVEERAKFAGWGPEDQLYHLKIHLDKTALEIFRNLPDSSKTTAESAIAALKKCFKPGGMEELRGLEFHRRVQGNETVGSQYPTPWSESLPSISGKDFDRLLKGRFYQALKVMWQKKLGPPKAEESFHDLLSRVMFEEYEKQYHESAKIREPNPERHKTKSSNGRRPPPPAKSDDSNWKKPDHDQKSTPDMSQRRCHNWVIPGQVTTKK